MCEQIAFGIRVYVDGGVSPLEVTVTVTVTLPTPEAQRHIPGTQIEARTDDSFAAWLAALPGW